MNDDTRSGPGEWLIRHSYNVRVCHWVNLIASGYLLVSGVHIFLDFPELYWGHTGYQGHPAIFKLSDWGMSWDRAGELGDRMWGRNYHITFAWVFLLNGVVYVGWNLATGYFRDQMSLARVELTPTRLWADLRRHLPVTGLIGRPVSLSLDDIKRLPSRTQIIAYGLNGADLPVGNGAPLRLRVERQCGYKNVKFLTSVQVVASLAGFGRGTGGLSSDYGFHWFAGV